MDWDTKIINIAASKTSSINLLLSNGKSRSAGLRLLVEYLNNRPHDIKESASFWITTILKACNVTEIKLFGVLIFKALELLVIEIQTSFDLSKWFGATYLQKYYESLSLLQKQTSVCCTISALKAVRQCLKYYPGPSKAGKLLVMQYLESLLDFKNDEIIYESGICWLLLQQVPANFGNKEWSSKIQWQDFQLGLLGNLNLLVNEIFPSSANDCSISHKLDNLMQTLDGDPIKRADQISSRFCHLIEFLKITLSQPYASNKLIRPTLILNLIQRGLELDGSNCPYFENHLPEMHAKIFELLDVLVMIAHTHLRMHFRLISGILLELLKKTQLSAPNGDFVQLTALRTEIYRVTIYWFTTFLEGNGCESIVEEIVKEIFEDIMKRDSFVYLVAMSHSKRSAIQCDQNHSEKSKKFFQNRILNINTQQVIFKLAFRCLQVVLNSVGYLIKPPLLKDMFSRLLEMALCMYDKCMVNKYPFSDWCYRSGIYQTLFIFIKLRNLSCSAPVDTLLYILDESCKKDACLEIQISCKTMIDSIEKMLHPQRESFIFKEHKETLTSSTSLFKINERYNSALQQNGNDFLSITEDYVKRPGIYQEDTCSSLYTKETDDLKIYNETECFEEPVTDRLPKTSKIIQELIDTDVPTVIFNQLNESDLCPNKQFIGKEDEKFTLELNAAFVGEFI